MVRTRIINYLFAHNTRFQSLLIKYLIMKYSFSSTSLVLLATASVLSQVDCANNDVDPIAEVSERCTNIQSPVLGCRNHESPPVFTVTYPDVDLQCKFALTLEQSAKEPTLSLVDSAGTADDDFYTIILELILPIHFFIQSCIMGHPTFEDLILLGS